MNIMTYPIGRAGMWPLLAACGLLTAGCVTINIYFPAAAAEKVADRIIDEVYQAKPGEAPKPAAPAEKK